MLGVTPVRQLWTRIETCHAVTYFADESRDAARRAGLRGFWMGYFGFRAAPLGAVDSGPVEHAFFNFAPAMVRRSIPDAWAYARPADLVDVRRTAARAALDRIAGGVERDSIRNVNDILRDVASVEDIRLPMFSANRRIEPTGEPLTDLWQHCTTMREHRGDIHVQALRDAELDGCEAHVLFAADHGIDTEVLQPNRGWTDDEWQGRRAGLITRGLLRGDGAITSDGRDLREQIEHTTDTGALAPFLAVGGEQTISTLIGALDPLARAIASSGTIPYPNPMGLPAL